MDSAMETSGSLPMSSAVTTSTMEVSFRFVAMELSIEERMPVMTTSSTSVASSGGVS